MCTLPSTVRLDGSHEVVDSASMPSVVCSCIMCKPTYVAAASADILTRIRCHLFSWIYDPGILTHTPCQEHITFFNPPGSTCKELFYYAHGERALATFGLDNNPNVNHVTFRIGTMRHNAGGSRYYIRAFAMVYDAHQKLVTVQKNGVAEPLMVAFAAVFRDEGDKGDALRLEKMKNWGAIVAMLRAAIEDGYDNCGEEISDQQLANNLQKRSAARRGDPNTALLYWVFRRQEDWHLAMIKV